MMDSPMAVHAQVDAAFDKVLEMEIGGDAYWRRRYAGEILAALLPHAERCLQIESVWDDLETFAQDMADAQVRRMNETDRRES